MFPAEGSVAVAAFSSHTPETVGQFASAVDTAERFVLGSLAGFVFVPVGAVLALRRRR